MPRFIFTDGYSLPANEGDVLWIGTDSFRIHAGQLVCFVPRESTEWHNGGLYVEVGRDANNQPQHEYRGLIPPPEPTTQEATMQDTVSAARHGTRKYQLVAADYLPLNTAMRFEDACNSKQPYFHAQPYYRRIGIALLMLAQKRALKHYIKSNGIDLGTPEDTVVVYPFTDAQYRESELVLDRFADAMGAAMTKRINDGEDVQYLDKFAEKMGSIVIPIRAALTDDIARCTNYDGSRYLQDLRSKLYGAVTDLLTDACSKADSGYVLAYYELHYGSLAYPRINDTRVRTLRTIISNLLSYSDSDEIDELLRDNDFTTCDDCGDWEFNEEMVEPYSGSDNVCRVCIEHNYTYSNYHDAYVHNEDSRDALDRHRDRITIHFECDDFYYDDVEDCYVHRDYSPPSRVLRRYHTAKGNDDYRFIHSSWSQQNHRFFGVELEVECRKGYPGEYADKLNDALNDGNIGSRCFFEEDGSLSNGFEIITQPMGLDSHYEFWEWLADKSLTTNLRSHDTSTCGLHVHINRDNINKMQINKMCVFIHSPDNSSLIRAVARRYGVGYASMHEKKLGTAHQASRGDPRYEAVNLTNRRTIEMRIFKGTLKHGSMLAALEFTNALVHFTAPASPAGFVLNTSRFMDYINSNDMKADTRNLRKYLTDVGFTS